MKTKKIISLVIFTILIVSSIGLCSAQKLDNPLGSENMKIPDLIGKIINGALGIVGSLALLMFIYVGLTWMTSGGNDEKVKKGKQILVWAVFGIVTIFTSYSILNLVFEILGS